MTSALDIVREAGPWAASVIGIAGGVAAWLRSRGKVAETSAETEASAIAELRAQNADTRDRLDRYETRLEECERRHDECEERLGEANRRSDEALMAALATQRLLERANDRLRERGVTPVHGTPRATGDNEEH